MKKTFWKNKKILITGHTGFKGSWLTLILNILGAKVVGYALDPISQPNFFDGCRLNKFIFKDYRSDIKNLKKLSAVTKKFKPEIIFHLAAQSSVLVSYKSPSATISTNVIGTTNILEVIKSCKSIKSAVIVTTDKVYQNLEQRIKFREDSSLGGHDIYSGSKAACEILTQSYIKSFFSAKNNCRIATVRSGNCIGGGDWTKDRLVKDCAESFLKNKKLVIRNPSATRPWQHVMEPLFGYLKLSEKLYKRKNFVGAWNFGPNNKSNLRAIEVAKFSKKFLNSNSRIIVKKSKLYESTNLSLNSSKSLQNLKWKTRMNAKQALLLRLIWYKFFNENSSKRKIINYSISQIQDYIKEFKIQI
jgi:CDP-glucose 4,6-dehydratase